MNDFSYMLTECKDSPLVSCPDFSFSVGDRFISVSDYSEGTNMCMSRVQIVEAVYDILLSETGSNPTDASEMASNIVYHATDVGLAQFVLKYCEV